MARSVRSVVLWSSCLLSAACGAGSSTLTAPLPPIIVPLVLTVSSATTHRLNNGTLSYPIAFHIRGGSADVVATVSTLRFVLSAAGGVTIATADVPARDVLSTTRIAGGTTVHSTFSVGSESGIQATDVAVRVSYTTENGETGEAEGNWDVIPAAAPAGSGITARDGAPTTSCETRR